MSQFIYRSAVQQNSRKPIKKPVRKIASMDEGATMQRESGISA